MKTIELLGGTGWSSTIGYYKLLNETVGERLGGYHSAKILLRSVDYHEIVINYGIHHDVVAQTLAKELRALIDMKPDCLMICCNSLHKYYDMIRSELAAPIPVMHAIELVAQHLKAKGHKHVLLLATKFTMEDGFFANILEDHGIHVDIPNHQERQQMNDIHAELMHNVVTQESRDFMSQLIAKCQGLDAVILGCTEYPLVVNQQNSVLPIVDPVILQVQAAVNFALA